MIISEAIILRQVLNHLATDMQNLKELAGTAEDLWDEFGEALPDDLFSADDRAAFTALQAKAQLRRDQLDARTVGA